MTSAPNSQASLPENAAPLPDIACLHEFWAAHGNGGRQLQPQVERLLLDTLGIGNKQAYFALYGGLDFDQFRHWIVETAGLPDPVLVSRFHSWLYELPLEPEAQAQIAVIDDMEPVLDDAQMRLWNENGFVVLPDAIPAEEVAAVRDLVWAEAGGTPDHTDSWYASREDGIMISCYQHPALELARRSLRIRKAFAQLWGTANLWVTIDRVGFNPPERPDYPFAGSDLHWDVSLARPIPFATQGVLYLTDTAADQGAFRCVPGFHRRIDKWLDSLDGTPPRSVDLGAQQITVPGKAGDLVIWRQDLPHGASPNRAASPRLVQYVNFYSPDLETNPRWL
ncbi:phytanoyl-CoA dioxygenase family protein [Aurantiacibacter zhengii]|uniref:Phytanoyl-CoA dioxygenase n=1 Tax=Aurantiacibacter zhengii TaxID=2307003 RepID=A0A418NUH1_9SPHN|nr:phytanoyl-CoA dioxygenase family protein [Aurantiacibacter zhengii]RIV87545.1 phytanoyl-CoA dioxygenase [Aurantiacibacter zhengii]